jgi:hypothetical protein
MGKVKAEFRMLCRRACPSLIRRCPARFRNAICTGATTGTRVAYGHPGRAFRRASGSKFATPGRPTPVEVNGSSPIEVHPHLALDWKPPPEYVVCTPHGPIAIRRDGLHGLYNTTLPSVGRQPAQVHAGHTVGHGDTYSMDRRASRLLASCTTMLDVYAAYLFGLAQDEGVSPSRPS